ncbi:GTP-binding protein SAR1a [Mactra antiquata]
MFIFDWFRALLAYFGFKKNAKLLIIGLDNAGKSTLLSRMSRGTLVQHAPTPIGRSEELDMGILRFTAYDLGGHPQVRRVWKDYFPAVDGVIFIVDSADEKRFEEARVELESVLRDDMLPDAPVAVLLNKTDLKSAAGEEYLVQRLNVGLQRTGKKYTPTSELHGRPVETFPCSVLKQQGYGEAMRWLAYYIQ